MLAQYDIKILTGETPLLSASGIRIFNQLNLHLKIIFYIIFCMLVQGSKSGFIASDNNLIIVEFNST
jgi:hypothetical protein